MSLYVRIHACMCSAICLSLLVVRVFWTAFVCVYVFLQASMLKLVATTCMDVQSIGAQPLLDIALLNPTT